MKEKAYLNSCPFNFITKRQPPRTTLFPYTTLFRSGTSGIGTTAIQLAKAFGARVIATAGSAEKCEACRKLGADVAVNYKTEDFVAAAKAATGDKGVDVILDMVGGDYVARNYEAACVEGRMV